MAEDSWEAFQRPSIEQRNRHVLKGVEVQDWKRILNVEFENTVGTIPLTECGAEELQN